MTLPAMPRILGPNLGCPEILSPEQLHDIGFETLVAVGESVGQPGVGWSLRAVPSFAGEGATFDLQLEGRAGVGTPPAEIPDDALPEAFADVRHTRRLTSTTLRAEIFERKARFWVFRARTPALLPDDHFRRAHGQTRSTLYDLELWNGGQCVQRVPHALYLRVLSPRVRFVHLTDLHLAERNDLWACEQVSILTRPPEAFINFNDHTRRFIRWANEQADHGDLDFVLALGDLVDFVEQGITQPPAAPNNWQVFIEILTGTGNEHERHNPGLRVPVFTTTGNHDWRGNPYPPEMNARIFGLQPSRAEQLDYIYRDSSEAVGKRIDEVHEQLVKKGSPILARSWWHSAVSFGLRGLTVFWDRLTSRLVAWANSTLRYAFYALAALVMGGLGVKGYLPFDRQFGVLQGLWAQHPWSISLTAIGLCIALLAAISLGRDWLGTKLRRLIEGLLAIEKSLPGLRDYFLLVNPYFNYAFRLENSYFLVLDTGHDCLTGQSFWDEGGKKIARLSVKDNIIGGSPDTMAFYPPNTYFPYSQIAWLERVLDLIGRQHDQRAGEPRRCRVFVGLHSPPANLAAKQRAQADQAVQTNGGNPILLPKKMFGGYNVRYGTINHYLSQFYYLCLGVREENPPVEWGCGVDVALAGHAHWRLEFKLARPQAAPADWRPAVYYGEFARSVVHTPGAPDAWFGPLLLQTAACGPPNWPKAGPDFHESPYYRLISVEPDMQVSALEQQHL